jgi:hypothetical protein
MERKEWCDRTERVTFKWKETDQEGSSVWTAGVRNAIRKGAWGSRVVRQVKSKSADESLGVEVSPSGKRGQT